MAQLERAGIHAGIVALALSSVVWGASCGPGRLARQTDTQPNAAIAAAVGVRSRPPFLANDDHSREVWQIERRFYRDNGNRLAWSNAKRPSPQMAALLRALAAADQEGLNPADYRPETLAELHQHLDPACAAVADLEFTYAYLAYARDLTRGATPRDADLRAALQHGLDDNRIEDSLHRLTPSSSQYRGLKAQLKRYRAIAMKGGWPRVPDGPPLTRGRRHPAVATLRERLAIEGDLDRAAVSSNDLFDDTVAEAVGRLQARHGLPVDGTYSKSVAAELDVPVEQRIRQIAWNMERSRWLPADLGARHLIVNIPAFRLDAIENGARVLTMKVVTGKPDHPTPVLADRMTYIVFSPYWNIPPDIVRHETLPHVLNDPGYLDRQHIEIVRGSDDDIRFRQKPGRGNSLGLVKFMFPNHFNVYLHDTPAQSLFNRIERDFSHGCVRLERPTDLAKYLLRDQPAWTDEKIDQAMHAGTERSVRLKEPIPVYLVYLTAWQENGAMQFRDDIYGFDRQQGRHD